MLVPAGTSTVLVRPLRFAGPVSYTHLDVYKRQEHLRSLEQVAIDRAREVDVGHTLSSPF